jgi:hypothetical protein
VPTRRRLSPRQSGAWYRPMQRSANIRKAFRGQGLGNADLETAVLAYKLANNLPLDDAPTDFDNEAAEEAVKMQEFIGSFMRHMSGSH